MLSNYSQSFIFSLICKTSEVFLLILQIVEFVPLLTHRAYLVPLATAVAVHRVDQTFELLQAP